MFENIASLCFRFEKRDWIFLFLMAALAEMMETVLRWWLLFSFASSSFSLANGVGSILLCMKRLRTPVMVIGAVFVLFKLSLLISLFS